MTLFYQIKQVKKLKTYVEKVSELCIEGKLKLLQLTWIDPAEVIVPLTNE